MVTLINETQILFFPRIIKFNEVKCLNLIGEPNILHSKNYTYILLVD